MTDYTVDFHVYGYSPEVGELISAKDAESSIVAIQADIKKDHDSEVVQLKARVAELETSLKTVAQTRCVSHEDLAIRDLEQQAKGLSDYANQECSGLDADNIHWMNTKAALLISQAAKLKGQDNDN